MTPYFYNIERQLFSSELLNELESFVLSKLDSFLSYQLGDGKTDGNNYYYAEDLKAIPEIKSFIKNCHLECFPMIVLHKPNGKVIKHVDDPNKRNTVIITPIHPAAGYASTKFWQDENCVAVCEFNIGSSTFFNTQKTHSLTNNSNEYRFNLQLCFDEDFETVLKLYHNNMLFKE
jgi:hypothetical protein